MAKVLIFILMFGLFVPLATILAKRYPKVQFFLFAGMVFFTTTTILIHLAPLPNWRGSARGYAFSMVDFLMLPVLFSMIGDKRVQMKYFPPGAFLYLIYFACCLLSGTNTKYLQQWGFEVLKMFWMYLFFMTAYNYIIFYKKLWPLIYIVCTILIYLFVIALYQKYFAGYYQIPSTMPHQNSLALYCILFGCILFGVLLNEKATMLQTGLILFSILASGLLVVFTLSRGGLACFGVGVLITCMISSINGFSMRRAGLLTLIGIAFLAAGAYAAPRIINRFENAPESSKMTRVNLAKAAVRIANAHTFGIGLNNFSAYSGYTSPYAWEQHETLKVTDETSEFGGIVETTYLLVAAECGWTALVLLLIWYLYYLLLSGLDLIYFFKKPGFGISVGAFGGLTANYLQSTMEWVLKQYNNFYQLMFVFALIAALHVTIKEYRKSR